MTTLNRVVSVSLTVVRLDLEEISVSHGYLGEVHSKKMKQAGAKALR